MTQSAKLTFKNLVQLIPKEELVVLLQEEVDDLLLALDGKEGIKISLEQLNDFVPPAEMLQLTYNTKKGLSHKAINIIFWFGNGLKAQITDITKNRWEGWLNIANSFGDAIEPLHGSWTQAIFFTNQELFASHSIYLLKGDTIVHTTIVGDISEPKQYLKKITEIVLLHLP